MIFKLSPWLWLVAIVVGNLSAYDDDEELDTMDKRGPHNNCEAHWSTRKCQRSKGTDNSTFMTCNTNSECYRKQYCCTVASSHQPVATIKCCVKHRKPKKKTSSKKETQATTTEHKSSSRATTLRSKHPPK